PRVRSRRRARDAPRDGSSRALRAAGLRAAKLVQGAAMLEQLVSAATGFIVAAISAGGYAGIVLLMAIESACVPLPSEIIMPFAGLRLAENWHLVREKLHGVDTAVAALVAVALAWALWHRVRALRHHQSI